MVCIDMRQELRNGRFLPSRGDRVFITGGFNRWKRDEIAMEEGTDSVYRVPLSRLLHESDASIRMDTTIEFKFIQVAGDGRDIANLGWETTPNRVATVHDLATQDQPFVFNEEYDGRKTVEVTFVLQVSPEAARALSGEDGSYDVVMTGSFCSWNEEGFVMAEGQRDRLFQTTVPIRGCTEETIEFRFGLAQRNRDAKSGRIHVAWENRHVRSVKLEEARMATVHCDFGAE
jgi:hypothetical protein